MPQFNEVGYLEALHLLIYPKLRYKNEAVLTNEWALLDGCYLCLKNEYRSKN